MGSLNPDWSDEIIYQELHDEPYVIVEVVRVMTEQKGKQVDSSMTQQLAGQLFSDQEKAFGQDLPEWKMRKIMTLWTRLMKSLGFLLLLRSDSIIEAQRGRPQFQAAGRSIKSFSSNENYFQTVPEYWQDRRYGTGWHGWSEAAADLEQQFQSAGHRESVKVAPIFVSKTFSGATKIALAEFRKDPHREPEEQGSSDAQADAFSATQPDALRNAQDALVLEKFTSALLKEPLASYPKDEQEDIIDKMVLPKVVTKLMPSAQHAVAEARAAGVTTQAPTDGERDPPSPPNTCDVTNKAVVPVSDFLITSPEQQVCAKSKYRTHSGRCNNICFPHRGESKSLFQRRLKPDYHGIENGLRRNSRGQPLPSARLVSYTLISTTTKEAPTWTTMFTQFGQFLNTPKSPSTKCCAKGGNIDPNNCAAIEVPPADPFYKQFPEVKCLNFVRSLSAPRLDCRLGAREQSNQQTAYIDGSQIYGFAESNATEVPIRSFSKGELLTSTPFPEHPNFKGLPKLANNSCPNGGVKTGIKPCLYAGDGRCNVQLGLQTMHTIWLRHHNNLAATMGSLNPDWSDEIIYEEVRAIVAAQLQHITYNEWLPVLLADEDLTKWNLKLQTTGRFNGYNISSDAGLTNEFSTAAFRVGHTMVAESFAQMDGDFHATGQVPLKSTFFDTDKFHDEQNVMVEVVRGMTKQKGKEVDNSVTQQLAGHLFAGKAKFGQDLVSLNIQRGRDHGLPNYMEWRKLCGLKTADTFMKLRKLNILPTEMVDQLPLIYESVKDIDLYPAGIAEIQGEGGIIGPTFSCIIGEQFQRLRSADRFWYENDLPLPSRLSDDQLSAIRETSLASILCSTVEGLSSVQPKVFLTASARNPRKDCSFHRTISLKAWKGMTFDDDDDLDSR
ncbi:Peroxidasin [Hypsibius exemplaris]|uniref:Peroxidasin n=1 Tax=Hypsibius exemplaris TaxID=2072580 RepID=A0A9X6NCI0_HYPEX|nr:Peroxidasin [Hypsibius exemplaris]